MKHRNFGLHSRLKIAELPSKYSVTARRCQANRASQTIGASQTTGASL